MTTTAATLDLRVAGSNVATFSRLNMLAGLGAPYTGISLSDNVASLMAAPLRAVAFGTTAPRSGAALHVAKDIAADAYGCAVQNVSAAYATIVPFAVNSYLQSTVRAVTVGAGPEGITFDKRVIVSGLSTQLPPDATVYDLNGSSRWGYLRPRNGFDTEFQFHWTSNAWTIHPVAHGGLASEAGDGFWTVNNVLHGRSCNVGVFATNPAAALHVAGTLYAAGDVFAASDARGKRDVHPVRAPLEALAALRPVAYTRKADGRRALGMLAQELRDVAPAAVRCGERNNGGLAVNYAGLVPIALEALRALADKHGSE